jgi:hypothetical protein
LLEACLNRDMLKNMTDQTTQQALEKQRSVSTILGLVAFICAIGWIMSIRQPIDANSLTNQLGLCRTIANAEESTACQQALYEMELLLAEYQKVLSTIPVGVLQNQNNQTATTSTSIDPRGATTSVQVNTGTGTIRAINVR